ncbi:thiosulfate dehydrogenase [quinone] large subunit [Prosthecobacter debontii]|uniref:Thiosulfate dehydrogenase [quinone] large subunit n=1 Tax=Prosthecobacter debontii TaxID=48467 RepID=A0A1T4XMA0_9BACT|nr:hypothetical protein [Prosthecobacter debontii]SKA90670.1 thiosulfate dehydrogenase [quinone] large subunit [Prosthecobacter debontii]
MSDHKSSCCTRLDLAFANLITRLWVAMRLFMAGVDKFRAGDGAAATFNSANYETKTGLISKLMTENSMLSAILPQSAIESYAHSIGYALIAVGIWAAVGIFSEFALFAAGLTFLSLGFGLAALPDDMELTANIGVGILLTAIALYTNKSGYLSVDGLIGRGRAKKSVSSEG